ncbi:polyadenylate-binding protein-interacting protein 1 isoform X1 [Pipistrellus kuhlii]|uniref:Polyadenylate-binding protein-interacting protein 1 n=1 Tax=Pipistrellus kuhlii TaxID=59472 RepID=A0A7J7YZC2_PIPKU|nr:polyadenylate-binding protein-interacting protein 1 isoform X1 [Pipistrellus kuhlii]KAF6366790.1 poly(A) binding protein interacting protein 1 [Pipistrellus kuhlii]
MSDGFDRAPGAGRGRGRGLGRGGGGPEGGGSANGAGPDERPQPPAPGLPQPPPPPLRQPRTAPPPGPRGEPPAGPARPPAEQTRPQDNSPQLNSEPAMAKPQVVVAPVLMSKLSANAPEFYPSGYSNFTNGLQAGSLELTCGLQEPYEDGVEDYPTLSEYVQDFLNHLTEQPGSFETEIDQFAETLNGWVTTDDALQELVELVYQQATSIPNFSYMGARLCNYLSHHLTISSQSGNFRQLLLQRCRTEYELRDQAAKGDEAARKRFHAFVLFLGELYLKLEIKGTNGQVTRADILQAGLRELLNALFANPVDDNLICAVKLLKLTGSVLEDAWKEKGKTDMEEVIQRIENVVLDAHCSRDVKQMLLKLVELRSSNWGRVHVTSTYREATPENDPNYFMNEPTFYTSDGVPFTAADPDYQEKYQELLEREDLFADYEENGTDLSGAGDPYLDDLDDEMDPEIEEAYEKFCLESERKQKQ